MSANKKVSELTLQLLTNTLADLDRMYWGTATGDDAYMTGATLKALAAGSIGEVATYAALPAAPSNGKAYLVLDASGDPQLTDSTAAWYQYRTALPGYVRITSVEELAGAAGDMLKSIYDANDDGKVDEADLADDIAGAPGSNKYYGTDSGGNKGFYNLPTASVSPRTEQALPGTGVGSDEISIVHSDTKFYTHTPHSGGGGTLQSITNANDKNNQGQLRLDTGGTVSVPGPDFDVSPSGIEIVGGEYQTTRSKNTLNYWMSAGTLRGMWEETSYGQI